MPLTFSAQVRQHTAKYRRRMDATFKQSVQDTVEEASEPVAQGGRMRVDTGFLRNSVRAEIGAMPSGPTVNTGNGGKDSAVADVSLVVAKATLGDIIFVGWSANYARVRNFRDGFLTSAAQNWQANIRKNGQKARRLIR